MAHASFTAFFVAVVAAAAVVVIVVVVVVVAVVGLEMLLSASKVHSKKMWLCRAAESRGSYK